MFTGVRAYHCRRWPVLDASSPLGRSQTRLCKRRRPAVRRGRLRGRGAVGQLVIWRQRTRRGRRCWARRGVGVVAASLVVSDSTITRLLLRWRGLTRQSSSGGFWRSSAISREHSRAEIAPTRPQSRSLQLVRRIRQLHLERPHLCPKPFALGGQPRGCVTCGTGAHFARLRARNLEGASQHPAALLRLGLE